MSRHWLRTAPRRNCQVLYYSILQYYTSQYYSILHYTSVYCGENVRCCTTLPTSMPYFTILRHTGLYCAILRYTAIHCTILHYTTVITYIKQYTIMSPYPILYYTGHCSACCCPHILDTVILYLSTLCCSVPMPMALLLYLVRGTELTTDPV